MFYSNKIGNGIIGCQKAGELTTLFTVMPSSVIQLKEGFFEFELSDNILSGHKEIKIIPTGSVSHKDMEELVGQPVKGLGVSGLLTSPIWGFKRK